MGSTLKPNQLANWMDVAVRKQQEWSNLIGINSINSLNTVIEEKAIKDIVLLSEAIHEKELSDIADIIAENKKRIILIAGPSSSGKTTFARRLCIQLRVNGFKTLYIGTDDYFVEREDTPLDENGERNYESLDAVDVKLFNNNLKELLLGKKVDLPTFDFIEGKKVFGKRITSIEDNQIIVIEGIHGLNEKLTDKIPMEQKYKIYIAPIVEIPLECNLKIDVTDVRLMRRMVRDYFYRGKSPETTILEWHKVREGENINIFPYAKNADLYFNSYHIYEISIIKKYVEKLLIEIKEDSDAFERSKELLEILRYFRVLENDDIVPNNSIIREFIGQSIFSDD